MTGDGVVAVEEHPPAEEIEGYRDLSVIGRGATSWVYRAYQDRVRRWVALKVLQADGGGDAVRRRFDRERSLLAELGAHPHIVQVLDAGRTAAGRPYVAMDLCDGSVADRVEREGPLDWPEALDIMVKIAGATQAAHELGVLHSDIKPQNILVSRYGPMLADFGIARAKAGLGATTGMLQMSPLYAAPEVFFGSAPPSEASDVYSLGASLYALLTGQTPFAGVSDDHVYDYLTRIQVEHPAAFGRTDLPGRLVEVVARSISADPARRHPDAGRFADELRACLHGRQLAVAAPSGPAAVASVPPAPAGAELRRPGPPPNVPLPEPHGSHVREVSPPRGPTGRPRPSSSGEPWRPAPAPPLWRRLAPAGVVALCVAGLVAIAVAATVMVDGAERTSATSDPGSPSTTAAPPPTSAPLSEPQGGEAAGDPFPALSGFGFRVPSDAGRYRAIEAGHRRTLAEALGADVPEAQTREVVAGGKVVGFVFAHPVAGVDPTAGERWATVELPGSAAGSVAAAGQTDVRVAASGKNWVASWWEAPNGFIAVFGNEALLRSFLAEWEGP